jgi:nitrogenase molybdenum-iron protein beta chain
MKSTEFLRTQCALQGALSAATAVEGVVPIVHSTAGCAYQNYLAGSLANGGQGPGRAGGLAVPSTNIVEKHVVFGGSARLREQIKNTVKVIDGKLYLVISGCTPNLVGDDSKAMTDEIEIQGFPAAYVDGSGFHGSAYLGYVQAVKSIVDFVIKKTVSPVTQVKGLVNIFGIVPGQDTFWQGDLLALSRDLVSLGLIPNPLFGVNQSLDNWKLIPRAELNLVLSPWGAGVAQHLKEHFGTPEVRRSYLPVGFEETKQLLLEVAEKTNLNEKAATQHFSQEEKFSEYFLSQFSEPYFDFNFQTDFSIVGPVSQTVGISRFLAYTLGFAPKTLIITDSPALKDEPIEEILPHLGAKPEVLFTEDQQEITAALKKAKTGLILGSSRDRKTAKEIGAAHVSLSFPVSDRIVLNRGYAGYSGGLNLLEDIGSALIRKGYKNGI